MTAGPSGQAELRSFGRKRGRKPSPRQQSLLDTVLPRVALDLARCGGAPLGELFAMPVSSVCLEIGFGGGEHLVAEARRNPAVGHIGCEPFQDGVIKLLSAIEEYGLDNVRVHADDVRPLLRLLPPKSLGQVYILYPDPWPKTRHHKRRLVSPALLDDLHYIMQPGAELRVATDIGDYARTTLLAVTTHPGFDWLAAGPADWRTPWPDWPGTRYEAKALREGRAPMYLRFRRRS